MGVSFLFVSVKVYVYHVTHRSYLHFFINYSLNLLPLQVLDGFVTPYLYGLNPTFRNIRACSLVCQGWLVQLLLRLYPNSLQEYYGLRGLAIARR